MSKTVIAAFSLSDLERVSGYTATFARKKGSKDKKKRMTRLGQAAVGAGALGALGVAAAGGTTAYGMTNRKGVPGANPIRQRLGRQLGALKQSVMTKGERGDIPANLKGAGKELQRGFKVGASKIGSDVGKAGKLLGANKGKVGAALAGAAALGGGALAASKLLKNKNKKAKK